MPLLYKFINNYGYRCLDIFFKAKIFKFQKKDFFIQLYSITKALIIQFKYNNKYNRLIIQDTHANFFFFFHRFKPQRIYICDIVDNKFMIYISMYVQALCVSQVNVKGNKNYRQILFADTKITHYRSVPRQQLYCIVGERTGWHFKCSLLLMFAAMFVTMRARVCLCRGMRSLRDVNRQKYRMCASSCQQDERSLD